MKHCILTWCILWHHQAKALVFTSWDLWRHWPEPKQIKGIQLHIISSVNELIVCRNDLHTGRSTLVYRYSCIYLTDFLVFTARHSWHLGSPRKPSTRLYWDSYQWMHYLLCAGLQAMKVSTSCLHMETESPRVAKTRALSINWPSPRKNSSCGFQRMWWNSSCGYNKYIISIRSAQQHWRCCCAVVYRLSLYENVWP